MKFNSRLPWFTLFGVDVNCSRRNGRINAVTETARRIQGGPKKYAGVKREYMH